MNQINDTPPEVIYLQWADHDTDVGATWCEHKINDDDVAYVAREKYDAAIVRAERAEAKLREISGLLSYRHGDDGRFDMPEDDENDEQEVVTIKRLFAILEDGE